MFNETRTQRLLRISKAALAAYREQEVEARKALASAEASVRREKVKHEALFLQEEREAAARARDAYRHCTK